MIEVHINKRTPDGVVEELAYIKIINISDDSGEDYPDYVAEFAVERYAAVGLHRRVIRNFPRLRYNVLALVRQALETLEPRELELERNVSPSDLARRQSGTRTALSQEAWHPERDH